VLEGEPGRLLVTARRKGATWYLGGMSAKNAHDLSIPLSFLGNGSYAVRVWKDAPDAEIEPNHLTFEACHLSSSDALKVHLSADGGFTAELVPAGK
jgi:alpha-glucosidase